MRRMKQFLGVYDSIEDYAQDMASRDVETVTLSTATYSEDDPLLPISPNVPTQNQWTVTAHGDGQPGFRRYREFVGDSFQTDGNGYVRHIDETYDTEGRSLVEELSSEWGDTLDAYGLDVEYQTE